MALVSPVLRHLPVALALAGGASCAAKGDSFDAATGLTNSPTDTGLVTTIPKGTEPTGYALGGELLIDPIDGDQAHLEITTFAPDDARCTEPLLAELTPASPPDGEPILAWWAVTLDTRASLCNLPDDLLSEIGIGAWDARLDVALAQQGFEHAAFGLYLRPAAGGPVWVMGLAGTEDQLAGDEEVDAAAPLADGVYTIASLVQTPWPSR